MSTAQVRSTALAGWLEQVEPPAVDETLAVAGLAVAADAPPGETIPLANFIRMTEFVGDQACVAETSWLIGEDYDLAGLGEVGSAVLSARTLGGALRRFADNFELLQDSSRLMLETTADTATVSYRILDPAIWPRHQDALFSLGIVAQIVRLAVPDALDFVELGFECRKRETGLRVGAEQLTFECEANSIRLPLAMLDRAMPPSEATCDPRRLSSRLAERRRRRPIGERLAGLMYARLAEGEIGQDRLAGEIGMSSRTMRRRLAGEATSFQQLLDDCRMRQAVLEFQTRPAASIAEIALRLGYAEHSTFTRAFTRWAGMPPQRFRAGLAAAH